MTAIIQSSTEPPAANAFGVLIEALWAGEISENDFIKNAHQFGMSVTRIEWEIKQVKNADGVL